MRGDFRAPLFLAVSSKSAQLFGKSYSSRLPQVSPKGTSLLSEHHWASPKPLAPDLRPGRGGKLSTPTAGLTSFLPSRVPFSSASPTLGKGPRSRPLCLWKEQGLFLNLLP